MSTIYHSGYGYSKRVCEDVSIWFLNQFLPRHKIDVDIIHRGLKRDGVYGYCSVQDCNWRPRHFLIEIQTHMNTENYTLCLLHELQHVLQHVRGDLKDKRNIRCWKGIDCSDLEYDQMPWEIEAHCKEQELYTLYLNDKIGPSELSL